MIKNLFYILVVLPFLFSSCAGYSFLVVLESVESPVNTKQPFGENKITTFQNDGKDTCRYEDNYIDIEWQVEDKNFFFTMRNKTKHIIKINWEEACCVDYNGMAGKVIHHGTRIIDRYEKQGFSAIPAGTTLSDIIIPADNISYNKYSGWGSKSLIPCKRGNSIESTEIASSFIGKKIYIILPIVIENIQNEYTFAFNIVDFWNNF